MKLCPKCGESKPVDEFHRSSRASSGRASYCKLCNREAVKAWRANNPEKAKASDARKNYGQNARRYGLSTAEYEDIIARGCAVCGTHEGRLCIDHDHTSGRVRSCLCHHCNSMLGHARDNPEHLKAGASYLEAHLSNP